MNWTVKNWIFVQDFKGHGHDPDEWRYYVEDNVPFKQLEKVYVPDEDSLEQRMNNFHGQLYSLYRDNRKFRLPLQFFFLRSTKWKAILILLRDYAELVSLCKVMFWKTHIPVRTQKWPPRLIFAGACHGIVINYVTATLLTMVTASKLVR